MMSVLLLREGYEADGWLGLLLGTSLWYGLFGQTLEPEPFERKMDDLARELGPRGSGDCSHCLPCSGPVGSQ